jgi:hypothetical protein
MGVPQRKNIVVAIALLAMLALAMPVLARPDRGEITVSRNCLVGTTAIQAGTYKLTFDGNKVSFLQHGKVVAEANGEWKKLPSKIYDTSVIYETNGRIIEIRLQNHDSLFALE